MTYKNLEHLAQLKRIVLGSGSPRRLELLAETGISFRQLVPNVDENNLNDDPPFVHARKLAEKKALEVSEAAFKDEIVIGSDTVVVLNDRIIGKPADKDDARRILSELSGQRHVVCTALALASADRLLTSGFELTDVFFHRVLSEQIEKYVDTEEPLDKAGAYGIQGKGGFLVDRIEGNLDNVIGLPRQLLDKLAGEVCARMRKLEK